MTTGAKDTGPLKLVARDLEDLSVISSMVQDAIVPPVDMTYLPDEGTFALALNRFRWETAGDGPPYQRTHAGLRVGHVTAVRRKGVDPQGDKDRLLDLLAIAYAEADGDKPAAVHLQFADDRAIRLEVSELAVALADLGEPWPTQWKPGHEMGE
ncbi:MAG: DUF2948 family protein [Marivibrio sp.]|uniref:DUF2948 family protein n=1 Tax=Marivibrio sp. TaxID=2039719 RepID=UPI0032EBC476